MRYSQVYICFNAKKSLDVNSEGYFAATVGKNQNEILIKEYVKQQSKQDAEYKQLYLQL